MGNYFSSISVYIIRRYSDFRKKKEIRLARSSVFSGTRGPADLLNAVHRKLPTGKLSLSRPPLRRTLGGKVSSAAPTFQLPCTFTHCDLN